VARTFSKLLALYIAFYATNSHTQYPSGRLQFSENWIFSTKYVIFFSYCQKNLVTVKLIYMEGSFSEEVFRDQRNLIDRGKTRIFL